MTLSDILQGTFLGLWESTLAYLPLVVGAIVVLVLGWIVAAILRRVVEQVVKLLRLDELSEKLELTGALGKVGIRLHIGHLLGWIVKWFFIVVALIAAADVLGWDQLTEFLKQVVLFMPNVLIAVVILLAGILLGNFLSQLVRAAVEAGGLQSASFLSGVSKWAVYLFALMAALVQLQIAPDLIRTLFTGLIAMLALGGGLAFGLGGKDHAARFLNRLHKDISER